MTTLDKTTELLTTDRVARLHGVDRRTIQRHARTVGAVRVGRDWLFSVEQSRTIGSVLRPIGKKSKNIRRRNCLSD